MFRTTAKKLAQIKSNVKCSRKVLRMKQKDGGDQNKTNAFSILNQTCFRQPTTFVVGVGAQVSAFPGLKLLSHLSDDHREKSRIL